MLLLAASVFLSFFLFINHSNSVFVGTGANLTISFAMADPPNCPGGNSYVFNLGLTDPYPNGSFSSAPGTDLVFKTYSDCNLTVDQQQLVNQQLNCAFIFQTPTFVSQTFQTFDPNIFGISIMLSLASPATTGDLFVKLEESSGPFLIANWTLPASNLTLTPQFYDFIIDSACNSPSSSPSYSTSKSGSKTLSISNSISPSKSKSISATISASFSSYRSYSSSPTVSTDDLSFSPSLSQSPITIFSQPSVPVVSIPPVVPATPKTVISTNSLNSVSTTTAFPSVVKSITNSNRNVITPSLRNSINNSQHKSLRIHRSHNDHNDDQNDSSSSNNDEKVANVLSKKGEGIGISIGTSASSGLVFGSSIVFVVLCYRRKKMKDLRIPELHTQPKFSYPTDTQSNILFNV